MKLKSKINIGIPMESLSKHTTFKIGGPAKIFYEAKSVESIINAVNTAKEISQPFLILGGGSNLLVSDKGFNGIVIKVIGENMNFRGNTIEADAGISLARLVSESVRKGLAGLEFFAGIPGTLGGAIFGNAGLGKNGPWIGDVVESVQILMLNGSVKKVSKDWMKFFYRQSRIKKLAPDKRPVILSATLKLKKGNKDKLRKFIKEKIGLRAERYPTEPCAGCVFKNLIKQPAAKLIEDCKLKGKIIGGAQISEKHANFIVNIDKAKAKDVIKLIELIKKEVKEKHRVKLEEEIQRIGF